MGRVRRCVCMTCKNCRNRFSASQCPLVGRPQRFDGLPKANLKGFEFDGCNAERTCWGRRHGCYFNDRQRLEAVWFPVVAGKLPVTAVQIPCSSESDSLFLRTGTEGGSVAIARIYGRILRPSVESAHRTFAEQGNFDRWRRTSDKFGDCTGIVTKNHSDCRAGDSTRRLRPANSRILGIISVGKRKVALSGCGVVDATGIEPVTPSV